MSADSAWVAVMVACARIGVWFSRGVLWVLMIAGHAVCALLLRQMEYDADEAEVRVAGSAAFESTALKLATLSAVMADIEREMVRSWRKNLQLPDNLPCFSSTATRAWARNAGQRSKARRAWRKRAFSTRTQRGGPRALRAPACGPWPRHQRRARARPARKYRWLQPPRYAGPLRGRSQRAHVHRFPDSARVGHSRRRSALRGRASRRATGAHDALRPFRIPAKSILAGINCPEACGRAIDTSRCAHVISPVRHPSRAFHRASRRADRGRKISNAHRQDLGVGHARVSRMGDFARQARGT